MLSRIDILQHFIVRRKTTWTDCHHHESHSCIRQVTSKYTSNMNSGQNVKSFSCSYMVPCQVLIYGTLLFWCSGSWVGGWEVNFIPHSFVPNYWLLLMKKAADTDGLYGGLWTTTGFCHADQARLGGIVWSGASAMNLPQVYLPARHLSYSMTEWVPQLAALPLPSIVFTVLLFAWNLKLSYWRSSKKGPEGSENSRINETSCKII